MNTVVHSVCSLHVYPAFSLSVVPAFTCTPATDSDLESVIDSSSWLKKSICPVSCPRMVVELVVCDYRTRVCTDLASSVEWAYETATVGSICENVGKFNTLLVQRTCRPRTMAMGRQGVGLPGVAAFEESWQTCRSVRQSAA